MDCLKYLCFLDLWTISKKRILRYRVANLLANLGWVDFYLGCSTIFPSCSASCANFSSAQAEPGRGWKSQKQSQPNPGSPGDGPSCRVDAFYPGFMAQYQKKVLTEPCQNFPTWLHEQHTYHLLSRCYKAGLGILVLDLPLLLLEEVLPLQQVLALDLQLDRARRVGDEAAYPLREQQHGVLKNSLIPNQSTVETPFKS